jgi:hypothetical protein
MAEAVVGGALLRILQGVVGFVDLFEFVLGIGIAGIAVRMELHGELAIGALEGRLVAALLHAQHVVVVTLSHLACPTLWPIGPKKGRWANRFGDPGPD